MVRRGRISNAAAVANACFAAAVLCRALHSARAYAVRMEEVGATTLAGLATAVRPVG